MPELKNLFIKGKMNKDLDERLVPQGEYRDALNVSVSYSEGSDVGALQNILGNTERVRARADINVPIDPDTPSTFTTLSFPSGATCIGTVRDTENDKIYWFGTSATADYIAELDPSDNSVDIILCEAKTAKLTASSNAHTAGSLVIEMAQIGGIISSQYVTGENIVPGTKVNTINNTTLVLLQVPSAQIQNGATLSFSNILNFNEQRLITGVAVLDGVLYFTDDLNEPRQVDIEYWRGVTATDFTTSTNLSDDRISLYRKGPLNAPTFHTLSASTRGGVGTTGNTTPIQTSAISNLNSAAVNTTGLTATFTSAPNYLQNDIVILKRNFTSGGVTVSSTARILIESINGAACTFTLLAKTNNIEDAANLVYIPLLEEDEPLFELKFPKFSFRYKYINGQYSTFAPFSLPAFLPGNFEYDAKTAYNTGMENNLRSLKLQGWITNPSSSNYEADIEEIDILYKDSVGSNVYIVDSIKKSNGTFATTFEIKDEQIFKATQSNQLLRPFDSIPRKAKALEITGNRLIFGNYLQNFNYTATPQFTINTVPRTNNFEVAQKLSLKTKRTYQLGVVFQDEYGRQTPVFTNDSGVKKIPQEDADFNLQFKVSTTTTPPSEATHYKYYIKETSNEYYNLCISNFYDDSEGFLYLSLPSSEVNKVSVEDFLIFKKQTGNISYKGAEKKFKVIDKLNNPPNFLAKKDKVTYSAGVVLFDQEFRENLTANRKRPSITPVEGYNRILIQDAGAFGEPAVNLNITTNFRSLIIPGAVIRFRRAGTETVSDKYTVANTQDDGVGGGEFTFEEAFGPDVNFLYGDNQEASPIAKSEIIIELIEQEDDSGNPEYEGRFFIKLKNSIELKDALTQAFDEDLLNTITTKNLFSKPGGQSDRQYYIWDAAPNGGTYSSGNVLVNVPNWQGVSIRDGFHIIISTREYFNDNESFYSNDPFVNSLNKGNYVRFSGGAQENLSGDYDFAPALFESGATVSGSVTNSLTMNITSITNGPIEVGDKITAPASSGFEQKEIVTVEAINGNTITMSSLITVSNGTVVRFIRPIGKHPNFKIKDVLKIGKDGAEGRICIEFEEPIGFALPHTQDDNRLINMEVREISNRKGDVENPPIFEVEPEEGVLDIYYETEETYPVSDLVSPIVSRTIPWANCISFGNGVESDRIRDDFNAPTIGKGVRVSTVFEDNYKEERVKSGLIFSQIYNGKNGINRLNQFIIAENITEEANPIYGSIQKLNTRDTDLTLLCDDKILKVPARKDLLFQADGNPQLTSTDRFLGTIIPYQGNYGCQHPESFADHIYRAYFVDRTRGKVLRLGGDGITEISNYGMKDYFKDKLSSNYNRIVGSYDENKDQYNVSFVTNFASTSDTVSFSEGVNGWPSRKSFIPEAGISLNNMYHTFKDGKIFSHDNETRNTFYSVVTASEVTSFLNGNPGNIKNFRTLNYQGDSGWDATAAGVTTNTDRGTVLSFVEKEGMFYNYIQGLNNTTKSSLDLKALNVQGLGTPTNISGNDATFSELNNALQVGDVVYNNSNDTGRTVTGISGNTITLDGAPTNAFNFFAKNNKFNTSGVLGYFLQVKLSHNSTDKKELYSVGSEVSLSS